MTKLKEEKLWQFSKTQSMTKWKHKLWQLKKFNCDHSRTQIVTVVLVTVVTVVIVTFF